MTLQMAVFTLQYEIPGGSFKARCDYQIPSKAAFPYHEAEIIIEEHPNFPLLRASTWILRISGAEGSATLQPPLSLRAQKEYSFSYQLWGSTELSEVSFVESDFRTIPGDDQPSHDLVDRDDRYSRSSCDKQFVVTEHTWKLYIALDCGLNGSILVPPPSLAEKVSTLYETGTLCDFQLVSSDRMKFPVHQAILAAWSPVFTTMFSAAMQEKQSGTCHLVNFDGKVVDALLKFTYARPLPDLDHIVEDVLDLAEQYNIPELRTLCEEFLGKSMTLENAPQYLHLAKLRGMSVLKSKIARFIAEHVDQI